MQIKLKGFIQNLEIVYGACVCVLEMALTPQFVQNPLTFLSITDLLNSDSF